MSHAPGPVAPAEAPEELTPQERMKRRFEILFGLIVTIFAAVLALNELASGKYGDDELQASAERTSAYLWYQSKGIKETEVEGQRDMMKAFVETGIVPTDKAAGVLKQVDVLSARVDRYGKEKREILEGSKAVGPAGFMQEIDGKKGQVVGVKDIEAKLERLGLAGDRFDLGTLFLQLSLVLGAIGIIVTQEKLKRAFLGMMLTCGVSGTSFFLLALKTVGFFLKNPS
jgi:hypothetical protein